ncbi:MAG: endonuclease/exonuclease/phosphatase family protein [Alphaproteobacteria bacterium]
MAVLLNPMTTVRTIRAACTDLPRISTAARLCANEGSTDRQHFHDLFETIPALHLIETVPPLTAPRPLSTTLRIAFWNAERCKYLEPTISLLARSGADVILLAEMDVGMARSGQRHTIREIATHLGQGYIYGVEFVELDLGDARERQWHKNQENRDGFHGGGILSPYDLQKPAMIRLESTGDWFDGKRGERRIGGRMAIAAKLLIGNTSVALVSAHLESHSDPQERAEQMKILLAALEVYHGNGPAIIGGDFNTSTLGHESLTTEQRLSLTTENPTRFTDPVKWEPLFDIAKASGFDWQVANAPGPTQRTRPDGTPKPPFGKIDWIFTRGLNAQDPEIVPAVDSTGIAISDHDLLAVTVSLLN